MNERQDAQGEGVSDRSVFLWSVGLSALVIEFLLWLIYVRQPTTASTWGTSMLPALNATFNVAATLAMIFGYLAIRRGARTTHIRCMLAALTFSALFFVGYVAHHTWNGDTHFLGQGWIRPVYFSVLISHVAGTVVILPALMLTVYYAARGRFIDHRRVARRTLPAWLYVSVTGVAIFALLRVYG